MSIKEISLVIVLMIFAAAYAAFIQPAHDRARGLEAKLRETRRTLDRQQRRIDRMTVQMQRLQNNDPQEIEHVLRTKYYYCRPNETLILFRDIR